MSGYRNRSRFKVSQVHTVDFEDVWLLVQRNCSPVVPTVSRKPVTYPVEGIPKKRTTQNVQSMYTSKGHSRVRFGNASITIFSLYTVSLFERVESSYMYETLLACRILMGQALNLMSTKHHTTLHEAEFRVMRGLVYSISTFKVEVISKTLRLHKEKCRFYVYCL